jgi:Mn2+/Fe2+ NRAMP family transporter
MNKKNILGNYRNSLLQNILGFTILAFTIVLGAKSILKVFNSL